MIWIKTGCSSIKDGADPAFSGKANIQGVLVMPLCALCRRNKASYFLYNSQNITEKLLHLIIHLIQSG